METHGDVETLTQQEKKLQKFLVKMSSPIIKKERKEVKKYCFNRYIYLIFA